MQVLQWAATIPSASSRPCRRRRGAPLGAEHRLPRGRPPGDHGRSRLARRRILRARRAARARASRSRAWRRTSPTCPRRRCSANSAAICRTRRPSPGASTPISRSRAICATRAPRSSTGSTPTPISTSPARCDYFDLAAEHGGAWPRRSAGPRRASASSPSPPTGSTRRTESRAIVQALNAVAAQASFVEIETDKGHDAFLLDEPECYATLARLPRRLRAASRPRGHDRAATAAPRTARAARFPRDLRLVCGAGARVLDVGCGDGELLEICAARRASTGAAWRSPRGRLCLRGATACRWCRATPTTTSTTIPSAPSTMPCCARPCRRRQPAPRAGELLRIAGTRSCRCRISAIGASGSICCCAGRMPMTHAAGAALVRHAQHPSLHGPRFSRPLRRGRHRRRAQRHARRSGPALLARPHRRARQPARGPGPLHAVAAGVENSAVRPSTTPSPSSGSAQRTVEGRTTSPHILVVRARHRKAASRPGA